MTPELEYLAVKLEEVTRRLDNAEARVDRLTARLAGPQPLPLAHDWTGGEATALRKALRMTERKFARSLDVSPRSVSHWARHPSTVPRAAAQDMLDELLAAASPAIKARFRQLTEEQLAGSAVSAA